MYNKQKLNKILVDYKKDFIKTTWEKEKFKWEAIKHFSDNWDITAKDFSTMLKISLEKCGPLLFSMHNFSAGMIINFAKVAPLKTRVMFEYLFDESLPLSKRISFFQKASIKLREKYDDGTWMEDFQNTNAISIYLWLRYPEKYYIYKYPVVKTVSNTLEATFIPEKSNNPKTFVDCFSFYDEIHNTIIKDKELEILLKSVLTDSCYADENLRTITIDFIYYIYCNYKWENTVSKSKQLTTSQWIELLKNPYVFNESALKIMKRLKDFGNNASCNEISIKYGETEIYYISESGYLAQHIAETLDLDINPQTDDIKKLLNLIYDEAPKSFKKSNSYIFCLKKNLKEALDMIDLSSIQLYENPNASLWKVNHSFKDFTEQDIIDFEYKKRIIVNCKLKAYKTLPISQGNNFVLAAKKGDFFFLCNDDKVKLIGQFTTSKAIKCLKKGEGWFQRDYVVIKKAITNQEYSSLEKAWTPCTNSTFIKVPKIDLPLFQDLILTPYFKLTIEDLLVKHLSSKNYWLLKYNSDFASFDYTNKTGEINFSLFNKENQIQLSKELPKINIGDIVYCYDEYLLNQIVAIAEISKIISNNELNLCKVKKLKHPITKIKLLKQIELKDINFFPEIKTIVSPMNEAEVNCLLNLTKDSNLSDIPEGTDIYDKEIFLKDAFLSPEKRDTLISVLKRKMNIILQGPTGVGKTFIAKRLAYTMLNKKNNNNIEIVQFHDNYKYEDFILDYRQDNNSTKLIKGIFYKFCQRAENNLEQPYFLIIEDINRGNPRKIFGEIAFLLEKEYRGKIATLSYSGTSFSIPKNLYIIGSMNNSNTESPKFDIALRRRFAFFNIYPDFNNKSFIEYQKGFNNPVFNNLINIIKDLNTTIEQDPSLGKDFCIGYSYFITNSKCTLQWMSEIINYEIIPLLNEYWKSNPTKIKYWQNKFQNIFP